MGNTLITLVDVASRIMYFARCVLSCGSELFFLVSFSFTQAAVVGDTVGDPLKDTSGPSLNILMKLMAIISLVFAEYFQAINNGQGVFNISS